MNKAYMNERKYIIRQEMKDFENTYPMTPSERKEVNKWVSNGNCIYTNPWYWYYENGNEMNYLDALRFEEELHEKMVTRLHPTR